MNWSLRKLHGRILAFIFLGFTGGCAMSAEINLNWEWPDNRSAEQKILVKIIDINEKKSGFFGIGKSPSLADNLPNPVILKAKVLSDNSDLNNKTLELTLPKLELEGINTTDYVVLGIVNNKTCICIKKTNSEKADISKIDCP